VTVWEGTVETEAFDFAPLWHRLPVGEVAWAVTGWGAEGQFFGETGEEAIRLHRWVEDVFVTDGADGSLVHEPYTPAVRERAGAAWVREGATAAWLDALGALDAATGESGYRERTDAAASALVCFQHPDGRFSSFGLDRRFGQPSRADDRFGDNARAALIRWRARRAEATRR
jgi:hypothetical protein